MKAWRPKCTFALALVLTLAHASQLPLWVEVASDEGWVRVHADAPLESLDWFSLGTLAGTRLQAEVFVDGSAAVEADAVAAVALLLDAAQAWASFQPPGSAHAPGAAVRGHVAGISNRGVIPRYLAYLPFTVEETSTHGRWLLGGGLFAAGLDDADLRTRLWRDTFLDLALLGSLNADLGPAGASAWFDRDGEARLTAWVSGALAALDVATGMALEVTELPTRLVGVVDLAQRWGVPAARLQAILDRTAPAGLHVRAGAAPLAAAEGSPFAALERAMGAVGLGLDAFSLASRLTADAFDAAALQMALTEAADARMRYFEGLADRRACVGYVPDTAMCEGLVQARREFDRHRDATYAGIAASLVDARAVVDYAAIVTSMVGHVAALTHHPVVAGAAAKASAGLLVIRTVASIADEGEPLRRAFLLAHLNGLQTMDDAPADPRAATDARTWTRNLDHLAMTQLVEWAYFGYLHDGYTGRFGDGTYALHQVTQWVHGSREVVRTLERERLAALSAITGFVPLAERVGVVIVEQSTGPTSSAEVVAWWPFDGCTREDASGNGHHATGTTRPVCAPGVRGEALLAASRSRSDVTCTMLPPLPSLAAHDRWRHELWFRLAAPTTIDGSAVIFFGQQNTAGHAAYGIWLRQDGSIRLLYENRAFGRGGGAGGWAHEGPWTYVGDGDDHHLALVRQGLHVALEVDGVRVDEVAVDADIDTIAYEPGMLGGHAWWNGASSCDGRFDGFVDEVIVTVGEGETEGAPAARTAVTISPRAAVVAAGESRPFEATVTGARGIELVWSADCGTVQGGGATITYRAPPSAGTCTLVATSATDPSTRDVVEVTVLAAGGFALDDDFASYRPGSFPTPPWVADANAVSDRERNRIAVDPTGGDGQVLLLYGSEPRNWSALAYHPCRLGDRFDLHARLFVASWFEDSVGRAAVQLRQGTSWQNPGRNLVSFDVDGAVTVAGTELARFEHDRWYDLWVRYERQGDGLTLSVWLDGVAHGSVQVPITDVARERSFDHVGFDLRGGLLVDRLRVQCAPPPVAAEPRASLTVVVIPSLMSALSLSRSDLVVTLEGPERHQSVHPSVPAAYPVTVVFDDIAPGTYLVRAEHGRSRLQREIVVRGATLQVDFVMP
jgi:hypothetical protein